ncbi:MAG: hypothetical protein LN561_00875 [Rickettsia endosymbiont of Labidopullus appendiculatus]|nr:hypothetical protein [Rickettsia endosymbiont of Labidopullus appendiculatus]
MTNFNSEYFNSCLIGNCLNFKGKEAILYEILSNEENVDAFSSFIQNNSHITALNLAGCNYAFNLFIKTHFNITALNLPSRNIGHEKIKLLINNGYITDLNMSNICMNEVGAEVIAKALESNAALISLNLQDNFIRDAGAEAIAKALEVNKTLISLNLRGNCIGVAGAKAIAKALEVNKTLTHLNIECNDIETEGTEAIAKALESNAALISLNLQSNCIGVAGAEAIAKTLEVNKTLTHVACSDIKTKGAEAIAKALNGNYSLTDIDIRTNIAVEVKEEINNKLQRNKEIKDISESFKQIISEITLKIDDTPLLSLDKEDSEQNSFLKILQEYTKKYGAFPLPVLEQIIAQSLYQNTVHVYQNEIEQLSFAARSDALTKITQTILEHLGLEEKDIKECNSKIVKIIEEVKEMFWLDMQILEDNLVDTYESNFQVNQFNPKNTPEFPFYCQEMYKLENNNQLADLYEKHPELKTPGTILHDFLKSDPAIYPNTITQLSHHADKQTFKHNPIIQKLLNEFSTSVLANNLSSALEDNNMEDILSWLSAINLMPAVKLKPNLLTELSQIQNNKAIETLLVNQPLTLLIDGEGNNLLHLSLQNGNYQLATRILKEGCINVTKKNNDDKTALDILQESPLAPEQKEAFEALLAQYSYTHPSNTSEHTESGLVTDEPMTSELIGDTHHTTDTGCIS